MTEIVQTPLSRRSPHKPMIGVLLASIMVGTILAVAPVSIPLADDVEPASADYRESCRTIQRWVPGTGTWGERPWIPGEWVHGQWVAGHYGPAPWIPVQYYYETSCQSVSHTHWLKTIAVWAGGATICAMVTVTAGGLSGGTLAAPTAATFCSAVYTVLTETTDPAG